jgi:hypothetical protein
MIVLALSIGFLTEGLEARERQLICKVNICSMTAVDSNLNRLHLLGNDFEREVAARLQSRQTLSAVNPTITLTSWQSKGINYFQISYSILLRPTGSEYAIRHFARLGTVRGGSTLIAAKRVVASDNVAKVARLKKLYGTDPVCSSDFTQSASQFWFIEDCFAFGR